MIVHIRSTISIFLVIFLAIESCTIHAQNSASSLGNSIATQLLYLKTNSKNRASEDSLLVKISSFLKERNLIESERRSRKMVRYPVIHNESGECMPQSANMTASTTEEIATISGNACELVSIIKNVSTKSESNSVSKSVNIVAGGLYNALTSSERSSITSLTVTGTMDARDFKTIRDILSNVTSLDLSGVTVLAYSGTLGTDTIGKVKSYLMNTIPQFAFCHPSTWYKHDLISIELPTNLTRIDFCAFLGNSLASISLPNTVQSIGKYAFQMCKGIKTLNIPNSVVQLEDYALSMMGITKMTIPSSVTKMGKYVYWDNQSLDTVDVQSCVLGESAFYSNSNLKKVTFGKNLKKIEREAFYDCAGLTTLEFPSNIDYLGSSIIEGCINLTDILLSADTIGNYAFSGGFAIKNVTFTSDVSIIGERVFCGDSIRDLVVPSSVKSIGKYAFAFCNNLHSVKIAADTIDNWAFIYCEKLDSVLLTDDVSIVKDQAFIGDSLLSTVNVNAKVIDQGVFENCLQLKNLEIGNNVNRIGFDAFSGCHSLRSLTVPANVEIIDARAFENCSSLISMKLSADTISFRAFHNCSSLKKIELDSGVSIIISGAFMGCPDLEWVNIPLTTMVCEGAFTSCKGPFLCSPTHPKYCSIDGVLYDKSCTRLLQCPTYKQELTLPSTVKTIGIAAFWGCDSLKKISNLNSVDSLSVAAFWGCSQLDSVLIPSANYIGEGAFGLCTQISSITISEGVYLLEPGTFVRCHNLFKVELPSTIDTFGISAFSRCSKLQNIYCHSTTPPFVKAINSKYDIFNYYQSLSIQANKLTSIESISQLSFKLLFYYENLLGSIINEDDSIINIDDLTDSIDDLNEHYECFNSFYGVDTALCHVRVPKNSLSDYKSVSPWKSFTNIETIKEFSIPVYVDTISQNADTFPLIVSTNTTWSASVDQSWLSIDQNVGTGSDTITLRLTVNPSIQERKALLTFQIEEDGTRTLPIVQHGTGVRQLLITKPELDSSKVYDGTNTAVIRKTGILQNVDSLTAPNIGVCTSAHFNNSIVGNEKSIILEYSLSGADSVWYSVPANDTILNTAIQPKRLSVKGVEVQKNKKYDGSSHATIINAGYLEGLIPVDSITVNLITTATYNDAEVGTNKTIKLIFSLSGSSSGNYFAPSDSIVDMAEIIAETNEDNIILDSIILSEPICPNSVFEIPFVVKNGTPTQYRIDFDIRANTGGLKDVEYADLPTTGQRVVVSMPDSMLFGTYHATFQVRNNSGMESTIYPFQFNVLLSSNYIIDKFDDIVLFDNNSGKFTNFQWYKNGSFIDGATQQYYIDPEGLVGSYSVKVKTLDGDYVWTCSKTFNIPLKSDVMVTVFPNPVRTNQPVTIRISGMDEHELNGAHLSIFDLNGIQVSTLKSLSTDNPFVFGPSDSAYIGHLVTSSGRNIQFLVVVK